MGGIFGSFIVVGVLAKMGTMRVENKEALAENQSTADRLQLSFEKLRTDMEKSVNTITIRVIGVIGLGIALLAFMLK